MSESKEMVRIEIVLSRDGKFTCKVWSHEIAPEARSVMTYGLLNRAILEINQTLTQHKGDVTKAVE